MHTHPTHTTHTHTPLKPLPGSIPDYSRWWNLLFVSELNNWNTTVSNRFIIWKLVTVSEHRDVCACVGFCVVSACVYVSLSLSLCLFVAYCRKIIPTSGRHTKLLWTGWGESAVSTEPFLLLSLRKRESPYHLPAVCLLLYQYSVRIWDESSYCSTALILIDLVVFLCSAFCFLFVVFCLPLYCTQKTLKWLKTVW